MMKNIDKSSYYYRYKKQAYIFQGIGIAGIAIAVLINELTKGSALTAVLILGGISALLLVIGGSSAQPHVLTKSFATLLSNEPTTENAKEFIKALEYVGSVRLVKRSQNIVQTSVLSYARSEDADPDVVEALKTAVEKHVKNKRL